MASTGGAGRRIRDWGQGPDEEAGVVARAAVKGAVVVEDACPDPVCVERSKELHLKFLYDLEEASTDREEYRFLLRAWSDGEALGPGLARWGDAWGVPDRRKGFVEVRLEPRGPGRHRLRFEVVAEYVQRAWRGDGPVSFQREEAGRNVELRVA